MSCELISLQQDGVQQLVLGLEQVRLSFSRFRSFSVSELFSEFLDVSSGVSFLSDRGRGFSKSAQQFNSSPVSVTTNYKVCLLKFTNSQAQVTVMSSKSESTLLFSSMAESILTKLLSELLSSSR